MSNFNTDTDQLRADEFTAPSAGPVPTEDEIAAADRSVDAVDIEHAEGHYRDMTEKGRDAKGEGAIE